MKGSSGGSAAKTATPKPSASGDVKAAATKLEVTDEKVGTGDEAVAGKSVTVNYTGTLQDGTVFDSTAKEGGQPFSFTLGGGQVIKGWDQGVVGMKVGGKRKLVIPPDLGYGSQGAGSSIPPNATLTFEITLLKVADASPSPAAAQ
jgi:FKBP-type peptidyl-prolyl cis-trans isomerase